MDPEDYRNIMEDVDSNCMNVLNLENFVLSDTSMEIVDRCEFPHVIRSMEPEYRLLYNYNVVTAFLNPDFKKRVSKIKKKWTKTPSDRPGLKAYLLNSLDLRIALPPPLLKLLRMSVCQLPIAYCPIACCLLPIACGRQTGTVGRRLLIEHFTVKRLAILRFSLSMGTFDIGFCSTHFLLNTKGI
jgi:hypothetical protein